MHYQFIPLHSGDYLYKISIKINVATERQWPKWNKTLAIRWNWSSRTKLVLSASWTHGLIARFLKMSERNSVSLVQIPLRPTFYSYFLESSSGEYHMYQFIQLHSCYYFYKTLIKINMTTGDGNSGNEIRYWITNEIRVAVQSCLLLPVELMAW